jgi:polyisoprenoid-binding protein YceI
MTKFKSAVLSATAAALLAMPAISYRLSSSTVSAQAMKVNYVPIAGGEYKIDPAHSIIGFAIRHYEINWVEGRFKDFNGVIRFDEADITKSTVEFTAKVESIDTGVAQRDQHLRTADFFDVAKFPEMTFKSTKVERKGKDSYVLTGDFTLKGVTKQVAIPFTITGAIKDPRGNLRFGIEAQTKINRQDYGITWGKPMEGGGLDVGNEVTIKFHLEALKAAPKPAAP